VGTPPSVFWIDRYEASVVRAPALTNSAFESGSEPTDLLRNGRWNLEQRTSDASEALRAPYFARSIVGAAPARFVTWFQASELCRMSGKQLPTGDEWITAALGTDDPGENNGAVNSACNTLGVGPTATPRATGGGGRCRSSWGARDMIGNVWEWTTEWYAGLNDSATGDPTIAWPNPPQQRHVRRRRYLEHHFVRLSRGRRSAPCRNPCRSVPRWPLARWGPGRGVFPGPGRRALELGLPAWASAAFCDGSPPRSLAAS